MIDPFRAAMLQLGLNLMVPTWGNSLSQIGQAAGGGVAAAGRATELNEAEEEKQYKRGLGEEDRDLKRRKIESEIGKTDAETDEIKSGESSRSRRLRGRQPTVLDDAAAAANLGPKGKAYLAQRIKTINQEDLLGNEDADPVEKFNKIIAEAQKLDAPAAPAKAPNTGTETVSGVDAKKLPLFDTPADVKKAIADKTLKKGDSFRFMQNNKEVIGKVP